MTRWPWLVQEGSGNLGWITVAKSEPNPQSQECPQKDRGDHFIKEGG